MIDVKILSDKQILERISKYEKVWEMTKEISDLNDYSELIREVTKREFGVFLAISHNLLKRYE